MVCPPICLALSTHCEQISNTNAKRWGTLPKTPSPILIQPLWTPPPPHTLHCFHYGCLIVVLVGLRDVVRKLGYVPPLNISKEFGHFLANFRGFDSRHQCEKPKIGPHSDTLDFHCHLVRLRRVPFPHEHCAGGAAAAHLPLHISRNVAAPNQFAETPALESILIIIINIIHPHHHRRRPSIPHSASSIVRRPLSIVHRHRGCGCHLHRHPGSISVFEAIFSGLGSVFPF